MTIYQADICMLVENDVTHDSRVLREAATLASVGWRVIVLGVYRSNDKQLSMDETYAGFRILRFPVSSTLLQRYFRGVPRRITIYLLLMLYNLLPRGLLRDTTLAQVLHKSYRQWTLIHNQAKAALQQVDARVYHAHDYPALLAVHQVYAGKRPIVYDSHELFFDQVPNNNDKQFAVMRAMVEIEAPIEKELIKDVERTITVGDKIADVLATSLDISRPIVLRNAVELRSLGTCAIEYPTTGYRTVVHSGGIVIARHLHELVDALMYLPDDVALVLMGQGSLTPELEARAINAGTRHRLHIVPPVAPADIAPTLAQADVAVVLIDSFSLSYYVSLPNKLMEAVAAGLPLVTSEIPELHHWVNHFNMGITCDPAQPREIAAAIMQVLEPETNTRLREGAVCARQELNWEQEEKKLITLYQELLGDS